MRTVYRDDRAGCDAHEDSKAAKCLFRPTLRAVLRGAAPGNQLRAGASRYSELALRRASCAPFDRLKDRVGLSAARGGSATSAPLDDRQRPRVEGGSAWLWSACWRIAGLAGCRFQSACWRAASRPACAIQTMLDARLRFVLVRARRIIDTGELDGAQRPIRSSSGVRVRTVYRDDRAGCDAHGGIRKKQNAGFARPCERGCVVWPRATNSVPVRLDTANWRFGGLPARPSTGSGTGWASAQREEAQRPVRHSTTGRGRRFEGRSA